MGHEQNGDAEATLQRLDLRELEHAVVAQLTAIPRLLEATERRQRVEAAEQRFGLIDDSQQQYSDRLIAMVTAIEQGRVTLRRGSETIVLRLIETPVRRDSEDPL